MRPGGSDRHVEPHMVPLIKGMLDRDDLQQDIAAFFGLNSGRIAEINTGQRFADVPAASVDQLPPPGPYRSPYLLWRAEMALVRVGFELQQVMEDRQRDDQKFDKRVSDILRIALSDLKRAELD